MFVHPTFRPGFYQWLTRRRTPEMRPESFEMQLGRAHGEPIDVILTLATVSRDEPGLVCYRWLLRDIGNMRRMEAALSSERSLLDSVIDAPQAIILVLDVNGCVLRGNTYLHTVSGYEAADLYGRYWQDVLLPPSLRTAMRRLLAQAMSHGVARSEVVPMLTRRGARREVIWSARGLPAGTLAATVLVGHDVTDLQDAQRQALQSERLATIGLVATGLAHEGRNALQRIQGCLSMLALRLGDNAGVIDLIERAQKAQDDLHHLFEDVRSYAADVRPQRSAADLGTVWREAWANVLAVRDGRARLVEDAGGTDLRCDIDPYQIKRVFRNLFENSLGAGADEVRVLVCRRPPVARGGGEALEVRVRDNGPGFSGDARKHLFEPFFTTRTRGTGLGLAICRRVIELHGGHIEAGPEGPGAEVRITLPRSAP